MSAYRAGVLALAVALAAPPPARAQQRTSAERAYMAAVASFYEVSTDEVAILADWGLAVDEIPAVLFVARHAGVSPEALAALRRSGQGWAALTQRYGLGASALHLPVGDQAATGSLSSAYDRFRSVPVRDWRTIRLDDRDVVALVNVRVIAQTLRLPAEEVIQHAGSSPTYVELFARLRR